MKNSYPVGNLFFVGLDCDERFSYGNRGHITIGGDKGDVHASGALNSEDDECEEGVALLDVTFLTTLDLTKDEVEDEVCEVVEACYDSIQAETFAQSVGSQ